MMVQIKYQLLQTIFVHQPDDPAKDGEEMTEMKRSLKDVGGVVGIPALGQIARKFSKN